MSSTVELFLTCFGICLIILGFSQISAGYALTPDETQITITHQKIHTTPFNQTPLKHTQLSEDKQQAIKYILHSKSDPKIVQTYSTESDTRTMLNPLIPKDQSSKTIYVKYTDGQLYKIHISKIQLLGTMKNKLSVFMGILLTILGFVYLTGQFIKNANQNTTQIPKK